MHIARLAAAAAVLGLAVAACNKGASATGAATSSSSTSASSSSGSGSGSGGAGGGFTTQPWLASADILVSGETTANMDCTTDVCRHSENTDLINWNGAIWLVHRTAESQVLGPNSSLRVLKSTDGGKSFALQATIVAPQPIDGGTDGGVDAATGRDIRDPHFFVVGDKLSIKMLCRLPVNSVRDSDVQTMPQVTQSTDGVHWSPLQPLVDATGTPIFTHSLWRIKDQGGVHYSAAYLDGDQSVTLYSSTDGITWAKGADIYTIAADTPLETELTFMPSGKLLALVRMDGNDNELLGNLGRSRTKICWADPPYASFSCPSEFDGYRLDGPLTFFHGSRLFVVARRHIPDTPPVLLCRKRTALFEITGNFEGGPLMIKDWGDVPSGGDTSYAGVATIDANHSLITWYSGNVQLDESWATGMFDITDIWQGTIDFTKL